MTALFGNSPSPEVRSPIKRGVAIQRQRPPRIKTHRPQSSEDSRQSHRKLQAAAGQGKRRATLEPRRRR